MDLGARKSGCRLDDRRFGRRGAGQESARALVGSVGEAMALIYDLRSGFRPEWRRLRRPRTSAFSRSSHADFPHDLGGRYRTGWGGTTQCRSPWRMTQARNPAAMLFACTFAAQSAYLVLTAVLPRRRCGLRRLHRNGRPGEDARSRRCPRGGALGRDCRAPRPATHVAARRIGPRRRRSRAERVGSLPRRPRRRAMPDRRGLGNRGGIWRGGCCGVERPGEPGTGSRVDDRRGAELVGS